MNNDSTFSTQFLKLLPGYRGIGKHSDRFASFLRAHGADDAVVAMFDCFAFTGQIVLDIGIVFEESEILCRNEFVEDDYLVVGATHEYLPLAFDIKNGIVGTVRGSDNNSCALSLSVNPGKASFLEFLVLHVIDRSGRADPYYLIPEVFNVDAVAMMRTLSSCGCGSVTHASAKFYRWLEHSGLEKSFCFFKVAPRTDISVGACTIESGNGIMAANFEDRRLNNPRFMFIGTCPDGCFIVLDKSTSPVSVGYVAFMEIGDRPGWEEHYVRVSNSFGEFLHDSGILGVLPDDYYQALSLGFRGYDEDVCGSGCESKCLPIVPQDCAKRQLATGEHFRVFRDLQSLRPSEELVANMLPNGSKDIWVFSSAGFGNLSWQVSCRANESDFVRFAEQDCGPDVGTMCECSIEYHSHTVCKRFLGEREKSCAIVCENGIGDRRFLSLDIPAKKGGLMRGYCYDRFTKTLTCWFGR